MNKTEAPFASTDSPIRKEGPVAKTIEEKTSKLPSDMFLWSAVGSAGLALALQAARRKNASQFVAQWVPTLLVLGTYNKLVKLMGHDSTDKPRA